MAANVTYVKLPTATTWTDLYSAYGITLEESALTRLMTPAPNKSAVENASTLQNGKRVTRDVSEVRKDERTIALPFNLIASSVSDFFTKYNAFCSDILDNGFFDLKTTYQDGVVYRLTYIDCTQFAEFNRTLARFTLNVNEPDPTNRGTTDTWASEWQE